MTILLFIAACLLLMLGHYLKTLRQKQFADIYEEVNTGVFLNALAAGYLLNFILPFRLGDLLRAYLAGRRMKNGFSFSLATVIVDRFLDIIVVGLIYIGLYLGASAGVYEAGNSAYFYALLAGVLILLAALSIYGKNIVKRIIKGICSVFNDRIELTLMFFFWALITAFRDIVKRISKLRLILITAGMWAAYLCSYYVFARTISSGDAAYSLYDIFSMLFSSGSIDAGAVRQVLRVGSLTASASGMLAAYLLITALMTFLAGLFLMRLQSDTGMREEAEESPAGEDGREVEEGSAGAGRSSVYGNADSRGTLNLLPQINPQDKLQFLESYFEGNAAEYIRAYLAVNSDISIIKDYSAGSNATTMLCLKDGQTIFRKYVVGQDADKLNSQIDWIERMRNKGRLPLPRILSKRFEAGEMCCYDMGYVPTASGFFNYIHSNPRERSAELMQTILEDLRREVYSGPEEGGAFGREAAAAYVEDKVLRNLGKIRADRELQELFKAEELVINGKTRKNLKHFEAMLEKEKLIRIFEKDPTADIHGDLTVENIICLPENPEYPKGYYLIDPNPSGIYRSVYIDYAKLLQSLHSGYEFYMNTKTVTVKGNAISFLASRSGIYDQLYEIYNKYLEEHFTEEQLKSIYYHEIVNWLRLMPYKLEKSGKRAVLFFAGLIEVLNDIEERFRQR